MAHKLITDGKHWIGWILSSALITTAIFLVLHLLKIIVLVIPFWVMGIVFLVVLIVEVIVDVIKHWIHLQ